MKEISWNDAIEFGSPYPYALATPIDKNGKPNVIGLAWWTITSWEPNMIAISIGHNRYSHECLQSCEKFALCLPSEEHNEGT